MDARTWSLALNTLLLCGATCAISLPLGSALAWLLVRTDLPGRRLGMLLLGLLLFVPLYVQAAAWHAGFGVQGWFTTASSALPAWLRQGILLEGWRAAIWIHSMAAVPWVTLIVGLGLALVEPELEEQAVLDGSPRQVFFRVTLRSALPAVGVAALWVVIVTAGETTVTDLFQVRTYAEELFTRLAMGQSPAEAVSGMGPGLAASAALVVAVVLVSARLLPRRRPVSLRRRWVFVLGRWRWPLAGLVALALGLMLGVPLANLCYKAGIVVTPSDGGWERNWSVGNCGKMVAKCLVDYRRELGWSLGIGALAATTAVAAAIGLAWPARRGGLPAVPAVLTAATCLALPGPVVGLGIVWLFSTPDVGSVYWLYDRPIPAPWLALTLRGLPLATLICWQALRSVPVELLEGAAVDGAGPLRRLWSVALPSRLPALALAWVVALAVALGDLGTSFLVVPPGVETLSIRVFGLLHAGQELEVAGICLGLIGLFGVVAGLAGWLAGRWTRGAAAR